MEKIKIVHIITGLGSGGAEHMLYKILRYTDKKKYHHEVISLLDEGVYGKKIKDLGIKVHCLNINKKNIIKSIIYTRDICKKGDIIDTWLYHADIFGFFIAKLLLRKPLIWNVRHSNLDKNVNSSITLRIVKINRFLSKYVDLITYNSECALENHIKFGYKNDNMKVIPNGFELDKFSFNINDRLKVRKELGLSLEEKIIITVGRWDAQKDYETLIKALNELNKNNIRFKMIMVGTNLDNSNNKLMDLINLYNLKENIILLGRQNDIPGLLSASDIYVSSSLGESFSNSIGEAMACELNCIVTDVGDSKKIVGDTGYVVNSGDYFTIYTRLSHILSLSRIDRNLEGRKRVIINYNINIIVEKFENMWSKI